MLRILLSQNFRKYSERIFIFLLSMLMLSAMSGCYNFDYKSRLPVYSGDYYFDKTIEVKPFNEMRGSYKDERELYMGLLPLLPYTVLKYDHPGIVYGKEESFGIILAEDTAYSLRKSKLFKKVYFSLGTDAHNSDYVLEGDIKSTLKEKYVILYGVTVIGCIPLWFLGAPTNYYKCFLNVGLRLIDNKSGRLIWSTKYTKSDGFVSGALYGDERFAPGITEKLYKTLNHNFICEVIEDIKKALKK